MVRLAGTNVEEGRKILAESGLELITADTLGGSRAEGRGRLQGGARPASARLIGSRHMSILIDETTPVLVQGITGDKGTFHAKEMIDYGTNVVGGVTPGKGGTSHLDRPVFNTVKEAVEATGATTSITFVAPAFCADAIMEAADAGIRLICSITDGIPAQDMMRVKRYMLRYPKDERPMMVGPNCAGIISPGKAMLGIMPGHIYLQGNVGVISRSGTLGYEAASQMKALGIGISTTRRHRRRPDQRLAPSSTILALFEEDPETEAVLMIGEIGGPQEAEASAWIKDNMKKPVVGFVAGLTAPKGRRMGHAGAIISAVGDSAAEKAEIMTLLRAHRCAQSERVRLDRARGFSPPGGASRPQAVLVKRLTRACLPRHCHGRAPIAPPGRAARARSWQGHRRRRSGREFLRRHERGAQTLRLETAPAQA